MCTYLANKMQYSSDINFHSGEFLELSSQIHPNSHSQQPGASFCRWYCVWIYGEIWLYFTDFVKVNEANSARSDRLLLTLHLRTLSAYSSLTYPFISSSSESFPNINGELCFFSSNSVSVKVMEDDLIERTVSDIFDAATSLSAEVVKNETGFVVKENTISQMGNSSEEAHSIVCRRKKLIILDVNGLLADFVTNIPTGYKPDLTISRKAVFKRPFCDDFLQFCFKHLEVGVWSSRIRKNLDLAVDFLMGDLRHKLLFCWDQSHCTNSGLSTVDNKNRPLFFKDLRKIWENLEPDLPWENGEFNASNTILLDDSPYKALLNPVNTSIFPHSYCYKDSEDASLGPGGDLRVYIEGLAMADNVQKYIEQNPFGQSPISESHPSWEFYRQIVHSVCAKEEEKDNTSKALPAL